jgi:hypothetical protein
MNIRKSAAVIVMSSLLMTASLSAWAAMPADNTTPPNHAEVFATASGPLLATESFLEPSPALQAARQGHSNCKASHIYGTSGVVGDKHACIMGGYMVPGTYGVAAVGGMAAGGR